MLVIGGGLAGLSATRSLRHRGHNVRLFDASDRLGGRVWTLRGFLAGGQVSEHGGEFVSSEPSAMRGLARKFGLRLENTLSYPVGTRDRYYFDGGRYPLAAATAGWAGSPGTRACPRARSISRASTSLNFQGYMEGAVRSGRRAAREIG